ncbi:MAG: VPLPA-CTERM sorting domain-containing protein [Gammaproteobacteria bacterium]|nr:VPLPA-CTERM sorting domain-containing protein [Gammaproteobacteria bacterium]
MNKTLIASGVAIALGSSINAVAGTAGLTGVWTGTYIFQMFSSSGGPVGGPAPPQFWSWDFNAGTVSIVNTSTFYASVWTAHDVTFSDQGDGTYGSTLGTANLLWDWSINPNIPIDTLWDVTDNGNGTLTVAVVYADILPSSPAFPGFDPSFSGSLQTTAVPIPAAVWCFGSGLLGLIGAARRRS